MDTCQLILQQVLTVATELNCMTVCKQYVVHVSENKDGEDR